MSSVETNLINFFRGFNDSYTHIRINLSQSFRNVFSAFYRKCLVLRLYLGQQCEMIIVESLLTTLKQVVFFEAAGAVVKKSSTLKSNH